MSCPLLLQEYLLCTLGHHDGPAEQGATCGRFPSRNVACDLYDVAVSCELCAGAILPGESWDYTPKRQNGIKISAQTLGVKKMLGVDVRANR